MTSRWLPFVLLVAVVAASGPGCKRGRQSERAEGAPEGTRPPGDLVARGDGFVITVADVQNRINAQPAVARGQWASLDKKKDLVAYLVNLELLAAEALRRGYDRGPDGVSLMKQQMIAKLVQKDVDARAKTDDVRAADIERFYEEHARDYNRPDQIQVSQILIKDRARAARVAAKARALPKADAQAFRDLVERVSEDQDSKTRGGEVAPFDRSSGGLPEAVVRAAFALTGIGEISEPIPTEEGFRIVRLAARLPGYSRPLSDVTPQIRQQLVAAARAKALTDFVAGLRAQHPVAVDERSLAKVAIDTAVSSNQPLQPRHRRGSTPGVPGL